MRTRVTEAEYEMLAEFRYALRTFLHFSEDAARSVGLTPHQHQAMLAIKGFGRRGNVSIKELAERLQLRHHSVVGLIDRLVSLDMIERRPEPSDRRRVQIALTKAGSATLEQLTKAHKDELRRMAPQLKSLLVQLDETESAPRIASVKRPRTRKRHLGGD